jgi:tetratricopeptide (TPR) repeat protein
VPENPRIEELRRRVQLDPASIAFAALAEEFRRMGRHEEAIETCRAGLQRHPAYLSARVTLGRALIEVGDYDAAREELETVLRSAPENLAAIRGLAQIHERQGHSTEMDPHLAAMMNAEVERVAQAAAAKPTPPPPAPAEPPPIAVERIAPEPIFSEPLAPEPVFTEASEPTFTEASESTFAEALAAEPTYPGPVDTEPEPLVAAIDEPFIVKGGPDPATLATLARLERFLAAIESARHA